MLNIIKHRLVLFNIINDIYKSRLNDSLGFKGGTMAYFFYGLDRFSVDLDFDLLKEKNLNLIKKLLPEILKKYGSIVESYDKFFTLFYLLSYEKNFRLIKIEVSKRNILSSYQISNFYGTDVLIQKIEDAFATKLLACTTRKNIAYRDFYDVLFYIKKGILPNENIIKKVAKKNLIDYLILLKKISEKEITNQKILQAIGELVNQKQKNSIKNNFKEEFIKYLSFYIDNLKKRF
ncbi:MAG: nucleotidyl transferase AbiEii/AbiGii toxin family protein [Patescibacteria group bacterium]|nr:nucleotidyl transferase AbiEii/AbiGii toxin family protein [Patescibacteria group bacterium]